MKEWIVQFSSMLWQRTAFWRSGIGLAILAVSFVGLRLLAIQLQRPAHLEEIAAAFGSSSLFHDAPQISHSGNQFTFVKTSAHGYALYLCNADTGQKQILFELNNYLGKHGTEFEVQALPWSPDDSSFLCVVSNQLVLYFVDTNQPSEIIADNSASDAVWLNPAKFVYLIDETNLCVAQKQDDGKWASTNLLTRNKMSSLTAISEDTVAWLEGNAICRVSLSEESSAGVPAASLDSGIGILPAIPTNQLSGKMPDATTPPDGLALWLDASKLKRPDQALVMGMADLSGNKNDAVWNGRPPILNGTNSPNSLNGKPTIHFASLNSSTNGTGLKTHLSPGIAGSAPRSIFVVMRHEQNHSMMVNMGDTAAKGSLFAIEWTNYLYLPSGWRGADNRIKMASTNWNVLEVVYDGSDEKGYVNGILRGIGKAQLKTADKEIEIGLRSATGGKNAKAADGDFAELLVYDCALNFIERKQVENYLQNKWFGIKTNQATAQNPYVWFTPPTEGLTSFSYSKESGQFLLNCAEMRNGVLWQYDPQTADLKKISDGAPVQNEQWFGDGESAYYLRDFKHGGIVLRDSFGVEEDRLLTGVNVLWFGASDDDKILFLGVVSNQPSAALWQFDTALQKLKPLIPYSDAPSVYAKGVTPTNITIKTSSGENLVCTIYPPVNFNPHKKYPLVIGDTVFTDPIYRYQGPCWAPAIANCGGYVVIVERKSWFGGVENWETNVNVACNNLEKILRIDTSQIYLFGSSEETFPLNDTVKDSPAIWKGVILLNPSKLPDLSQAPQLQQRPKILLSDGDVDNNGNVIPEDENLKKLQKNSLGDGVMVEYIVHHGEAHHVMGNAAQLERTKAILHFIFEE